MIRFVLIAAVLAAGCSRDPKETALRNLASSERYFERGQYRQAEILLKRALRADPKLAVAHARLTDVLLKSKRVGEAINPLRRAVELLPEGPERTLRRIQLADSLLFYLEQAHQNSQVVEEVEELATGLGETYDGLRLRGRLYTVQARALAEKGGIIASSKEMREAIVVLSRAEALKPLTEEVTIPLARSLWLEEERDRATKLLVDLTQKTPQSVVAWSDLIRFLEAGSRLDEADRTIRAAIQANPEHDSFRLRLAGHWRARRDTSKVEQALSDLRATASRNPNAHEMIAAFYQESGETAKAIAEFAAAKNLNPKRATLINLQIIDLHITERQRDRAWALMKTMLSEDGRNPLVRVRHAALLLDDGKSVEAIAELEKVAQEIPSDFSTHYNLGRARRKAGQQEMARLALLECLRLNPNFLPAERELMAVLVETEQWGNALLSSEKILARSRDSRAGLVRVMALRHLGKPIEARAQLEFMKDWDMPAGLRLLERGRIEAAEGRRDEALRTYRAAFQAGSVEALVELAQMQANSGQSYSSIESDCKKNPANAELQMVCADFALIAGKLDAALQAYETALGQIQDPVLKVRLLTRSGETLRRAKRIPDALARFTEAAKVLPDSPEVNHLLGIALDQSGRKDEAIAAYERSLKGNPNNAIVLNNLAWHIYLRGGDLDIAQTYAQRARQLSPNNLEFSDTLGMIYLRKNLKQNAVSIFKELVQKSPGNAAFREHLRQAESGT